MLKNTLAVVTAFACAAASVLHAQVAPAASPAACMDSIRVHVRALYESAQAAHQIPDQTAIRHAAAARASACTAAFASTPSDDPAFVGTMGVLYLFANDTAHARRTFTQLIEAPGLSDSARIVAIVNVMRAWQGIAEPDAASAETKSLLERLDRIPGAPAMRLEAHASLIPRYEDFDDDPHTAEQVRAIQALIPTLSDADRRTHAKAIVQTYLSLAKLQANALHPDSALATLAEVSHLLPGIADSLGAARDRRMYRLIGTPAPAVHADYWLNGPAAPLKGDGPSVLVFTGEWCHSCHDAYPTLLEYQRQFAPKGLHYTYLIELMGQFDGQPTTADEEVADNKHYYLDEEKFTAPLAIQRGSHGDGAPPTDMANTEAYAVHYWPMIVVVDRTGIIRGILQGWDPYGKRGEMLKTLIERTLS